MSRSRTCVNITRQVDGSQALRRRRCGVAASMRCSGVVASLRRRRGVAASRVSASSNNLRQCPSFLPPGRLFTQVFTTGPICAQDFTTRFHKLVKQRPFGFRFRCESNHSDESRIGPVVTLFTICNDRSILTLSRFPRTTAQEKSTHAGGTASRVTMRPC